MMDKEATISVFTGTLWEAEMIKSLLAEVSINSFLKNTTLSSYALEPILSESIQVIILESDLQNARPVIQAFLDSKKNT